MKRNTTFGLLLVAAMVFCGGCYPYHFTTEPGARGRVADARTHAPVAGAKVVRTLSGMGYDVLSPRETVSGADGSFFFPAVQEWGIDIMQGFENGGHEARFVFLAPGYKPVTRQFDFTSHGPAMKDLGTVEMRKDR